MNRSEDSVPRWIPVSERRPAEGETVLVVEDGQVTTNYIPYAHTVPADCRYRWRSGNDFITHWMPMPAKPSAVEPVPVVPPELTAKQRGEKWCSAHSQYAHTCTECHAEPIKSGVVQQTAEPMNAEQFYARNIAPGLMCDVSGDLSRDIRVMSYSKAMRFAEAYHAAASQAEQDTITALRELLDEKGIQNAELKAKIAQKDKALAEADKNLKLLFKQKEALMECAQLPIKLHLAERERDQAREALRQYGSHRRECPASRCLPNCNCGFSAAVPLSEDAPAMPTSTIINHYHTLNDLKQALAAEPAAQPTETAAPTGGQDAVTNTISSSSVGPGKHVGMDDVGASTIVDSRTMDGSQPVQLLREDSAMMGVALKASEDTQLNPANDAEKGGAH